jgi:DNA-binding response OmpR family regulator
MTAVHQARAHDETDSPRRMLVVEDHASIAELIELWFTADGWEVIVAHSGPEGVARGVAFRPDVAVLDVMLPGYGGLEVLRRLRVTDGKLPVILSTAMDSEEDRAAASKAGANAYLVKPWSLRTLQETVDLLTTKDS